LPIYEVFIILKDVTITWQKWGSKQVLKKRKTNLSLMEVFNIGIVQHFLQQEAVQTIPWPAVLPDMNPIEHVWYFLGRKINQRKHNVPVFLVCQITIKNLQVQHTVKGKTTPDSYTPTPKSSCAQNVCVSLAPNPCTTVGRA
jgi:hypothetical protein